MDAAYTDNKTLDEAKMAGPFGHITKFFEDTELRVTIEIAIYKAKAEKEGKNSLSGFRKRLAK